MTCPICGYGVFKNTQVCVSICVFAVPVPILCGLKKLSNQRPRVKTQTDELTASFTSLAESSAGGKGGAKGGVKR